MTDSKANKMIIAGVDFNASTDYNYTKPKINSSGGKSIGIINKESMKGLYLSTPLMLTWGVNENDFDGSGKKSYDMSLQFPKEEYNNDTVQKFLDNMIAFENKLKEDAMNNSKEWMNKAKMSPDVIDALWTPMIKYPKDQSTGEFDRTRAPTIRIKFPVWDGEWKCELYDMEQQLIFPNDTGLFPTDLIGKATNVATVIQCGGLWFANGKFGITWKLVQAVVKPKQSMLGKCFINLSVDEKETMSKKAPGDDVNDDDDDGVDGNNVQVVDSSEDEAEPPTKEPVKEVAKEVAKEVTKEIESNAPPAAKKKVVRKKKVEESA
jgi:hypothetical protein